MKDADGFYVLIPHKEPGYLNKLIASRSKPKEVQNDSNENNKKKKVKFKKGTWKHSMLKLLRKWKPSRFITEFHQSKLENLVIYGDGKLRADRFTGPFDASALKSIRKKNPTSFVLINTGTDAYIKIPIKSYIRLANVDKIGINFTLTCGYDEGYTEDDEDRYDIVHDERVIDSINELLLYVEHIRHMVDGIFGLQALCCGYNRYEFLFKIMVYNKNGTVKTYKSDMNDFLEDYDLDKI